MTPQDIAYRASGSEKWLLKLLDEHGAKIFKSQPEPNYELSKDDRKKLLQIHVVFPDGTVGFFSPGGPPRLWNYMWIGGWLEKDAELIRSLRGNLDKEGKENP
jgi:hypothetical protein